MLRSSLFVFIAGWVVRFWIDKPRAGPFKLPPPDDSLVEHFQRAFDILKAGYLDLAFVYIWNAHYLLLSLLRHLQRSKQMEPVTSWSDCNFSLNLPGLTST